MRKADFISSPATFWENQRSSNRTTASPSSQKETSPRPWPILQVERRLVRIGCTARYRRVKLQELADHHEDSKLSAMEEGMPEAEAELRANERLGDPVDLADNLAFVLRQSTWWGRHPIIGFCLLPNVAVMPLTVVCILLLCSGFWLANLLPGATLTISDWGAASSSEPESFASLFQLANQFVDCATAGILALLLCWAARRSASGLKWSFAACLVASLHGLFNNFVIKSHLVSWGYATSPNWMPAAVPLLIWGAIYFRQRQTEKRLALAIALPGKIGADATCQTCRSPMAPKINWITPSSIVATVLIVGIAGLAVWARVEYVRGQSAEKAKQTLLKSKIWPEERAAAEKQIQARQLVCEATNARTIDLRGFVNVSPSDSIRSKRAPDDNLAALPSGIHIYGGVPFDVEGRIQLMGRGLAEESRFYPTRARGISISCKCARLHLFHGASFVPQSAADPDDKSPDVKIAALVLHYTDGSQEEIAIRAGENVLDWRGPAYTSGVAEELSHTTAPGTELAWVGSNPDLRKTQPELSLRLYKSTFANPRPELEIASVYYVSTLTQAAPFLVGLTVE